MNRGFKDAIELWMIDHIGSAFPDWPDIAIQCANSVGCSMVTSDRWIVQLSNKTGPFKMVRNDGGNLVIQIRSQK